MNPSDYVRLRTDLLRNGSLDFSKREELIEFFAELMAERYKNYAAGLTGIPLDEKDCRVNADPRLVKMEVTAYLNENMARSPQTIIEFIVDILLGWLLKPQNVVIGIGGNKEELYKKILKRIGRSDRVDHIFEPRVEYTIIGETRLERRTS